MFYRSNSNQRFRPAFGVYDVPTTTTPSRNTSLFNTLTYTPTASYSYTYNSTYVLSLINDDNLSAGVIKTGGGVGAELQFTVTFSSSVFINRVGIRTGQFNGNFNGFYELELWDSTFSTLLYYIKAAAFGTWYTYTNIDTTADADLDTARTVYGVKFKNATPPNVSCRELDFFGHIA